MESHGSLLSSADSETIIHDRTVDSPDVNMTLVDNCNGLMNCNICFNAPPTSPVTTYCGHMFCWPCLYQWLQDLDQEKPCPVCRTMLRSNINIVPIYATNELAGDGDGRSAAASNSNMGIPPRPHPPGNPPSPTLELGSSQGQFPTQSQVLAAIDMLLLVTRRLQGDRIAVCHAQRASFDALSLELARMHALGQHVVDNSLDPEQEQLDVDLMRDLITRSQDALQESRRARNQLEETREMREYIVGLRDMVVQAHREMPSWWTSGIEI